MLLSEIKAGTNITLEVIAGSKRFDIPLRVERVDQFAILTNTFRYGGNVVDLSNKSMGHLLFNVYASDAKNQGRFVWKGVKLECTTVRGIPYYSLKAKNVLQHGLPDNRRGENRLLLQIPGEAFSETTGKTVFVKLHDISNQGISFYGPKGFADVNDVIDIRFMEQVADHSFDIRVEAQCVRTRNEDSTTELYGCKLRAPNREILTYICLKQLIEKRKDKEEQLLN